MTNTGQGGQPGHNTNNNTTTPTTTVITPSSSSPPDSINCHLQAPPNSLPPPQQQSIRNTSQAINGSALYTSQANRSQSSSPVDLHYYNDKICVHQNVESKCENCHFSQFTNQSINKWNAEQASFASNFQFPNKFTMNTLNPESLLGHDPKHLFGSSAGGGMSMGMGNLGHLGHIGTSISGSVMNPHLTMANSHLHHSHHPSSHHQSLHSMSAPGFSLHGHLASVSNGQQRRMSSNASSSNRMHKHSSNSNNNSKTFLCPMCNKLFTQKGNLKTHMMIHTGDKPYVCHVCGKSFTQKGNVDTHIKIHTGVKDYGCDRCGKSFTQKGNLRTHVRSVHTKEKPFACAVCGKSFSQRGNMHTHIRTHNKDDRFPCGLCGKTFSQKGNLKTHMQRHAGTLPKRYGPGGQRRQATSRLLQVSGISSAGTAAVAAAAAYAIAAAGNVNPLDRSHQMQHHHQQHQQQQQQSQQALNSPPHSVIPLSRATPGSVENGENSRSPGSLVHSSTASMNGSAQRSISQPQSVITNVQNQQSLRSPQDTTHSLYPACSPNNYFTTVNMTNANGFGNHHHHLSANGSNSFNHGAAAAAAAVLLSSTTGFKDTKANHLHFMSSLFH